MLSPEEENKIDYLNAIIQDYKRNDNYPTLVAYDIEWLAVKLKEINDELKSVYEEIALAKRAGYIKDAKS
jgi:hypothetical protein